MSTILRLERTCWERGMVMTISENIFELLKRRGMSQREFSERTGIAQSTISDWKRKKTNPVSEKILIICEVLEVTPYELLGGTDGRGERSNPSNVIVIDKNTEHGELICEYLAMDDRMQQRLIGYMRALQEIANKQQNKGVKSKTDKSINKKIASDIDCQHNKKSKVSRKSEPFIKA